MSKNTNFRGLAARPRAAQAWARTVGMAVVASLLPPLARAQTATYAAPIVISKGGTYTGNYRSESSAVACVRIATNEPVILENCQLLGAGNLIEAGEGANLTVRGCRGQGLTPSVDNQAPGRFLDVYRPARLVVEHNLLTQTSGLVVNRWGGAGQAGQTLTVRYNQARNIDGRWRNAGSTRSSFLLLNTVQHLAGAEVAYNEVLNTPDQSLVEDNINLYNASGTAQSPLRVHDNFVRGAYPFPATASQFTGTGMTTDGDAKTADEATAFIEADHNQFVSTANAAMNLAAGHDIRYHDNRLVTSGLLPDGRRLSATYAATAVFNYYQQPADVFFNNRVENNVIGYVRWGAADPYPDRQDQSPGACAPCAGTQHLPNPVTLATEDNEWQLWQQKLQQSGLVVGPISASSATPAPAPPVPTPPAPANGQVFNPGFEADGAAVGAPTGWQTATMNGTNDNADYTETYGGAHAGTYHGTHYRPEGYEVYTYQTIGNLPAGTYSLKAWVKSGGGQPVAQLQAKNYGGTALSANLTGTNGNWTQVEVRNINVSNGQCEVGFYSRANAGQWLYFDDVELGRQNTPPTVALTAATSLVLGQPLALSATAADSDGTVAKVEFFNGPAKLGEATAAPYQLSWTPTAAGAYSLTARATDNAGASTLSAAVTLSVAGPAPAPPAPVPTPSAPANAIINPGFEADGAAVGAPAGWQTATMNGTNDNADYTETYPGAHAGTYHGTHYRPEGYEVYTYQTISNLPAGTYSFRAWVRSGGGQPVAQLQARNYGGALLTSAIPATGGNWAQVEVRNINVSNGQCEVGFYSKANAGQWLYFDDVELARQDSTPAPGATTTTTTTAPVSTATLYPNPANDQVTVVINYAQATNIVLLLTDLQGTTIAKHWRPVAAGDNQVVIPTTYLPSGLYILQIQSNGNVPPQTLRLEVRH